MYREVWAHLFTSAVASHETNVSLAHYKLGVVTARSSFLNQFSALYMVQLFSTSYSLLMATDGEHLDYFLQTLDHSGCGLTGVGLDTIL